MAHIVKTILPVVAALVAAFSAQSALAAVAASSAYPPENYLVFIDEPTGFSFIKTPVGWKFIRKLDSEQTQAAMQLEQGGTPGLRIAHMPIDPQTFVQIRR